MFSKMTKPLPSLAILCGSLGLKPSSNFQEGISEKCRHKFKEEVDKFQEEVQTQLWASC
jgi:hypothetical protein